MAIKKGLLLFWPRASSTSNKNVLWAISKSSFGLITTTTNQSSSNKCFNNFKGVQGICWPTLLWIHVWVPILLMQENKGTSIIFNQGDMKYIVCNKWPHNGSFVLVKDMDFNIKLWHLIPRTIKCEFKTQGYHHRPGFNLCKSVRESVWARRTKLPYHSSSNK